MRKLKLDLETLSVESFEMTCAGSGRHGTVHGAEATGEPETVVIGDTGVMCTNTWPSAESCEQTCQDGCWATLGCSVWDGCDTGI